MTINKRMVVEAFYEIEVIETERLHYIRYHQKKQ